jgi:hypothetical protein
MHNYAWHDPKCPPSLVGTWACHIQIFDPGELNPGWHQLINKTLIPSFVLKDKTRDHLAKASPSVFRKRSIPLSPACVPRF